jgi:riboflavin synthase
MFTGIIEHAGKIIRVSPAGAGARIAVDLGPASEGVKPGDSVAVSGVCLTAAKVSGATAEFDAVAETLSRTTLGKKRPGDLVNIERALAAGARLGGHIVQGHIDGVAKAARVVKAENAWELHCAADRLLTEEMIEKGSVALDGVSLTIAGVDEKSFRVALIPTTLEATTLGRVKEGDELNVETDVLGKYVSALLRRMMEDKAPAKGKGLTREYLAEHGFI